MSYRELLLGCGRSREKRLVPPGCPNTWQGLVTLDNNPDVKPDLVCDLDEDQLAWCVADYWGKDVPPYISAHGCILAENSFDEIHAYEVLEHLGSQGNYRAFFHHFSEIWRLLKPNGYLCATVPSRYSGWLWGDISHKRAILPESLSFLDQSEYVRQCDSPRPTSMSDFRSIYKADFRCIDKAESRESFMFILQCVKPSRWKAPT